jgi:hypothetical protein
MYRCGICGADYPSFEEYKRYHSCFGVQKKIWGIDAPETKHDPVRSPEHYTAGGIETWDYMESKMTPEMYEGYLIGNVIKYVSRYHRKNGLEDLEKAHTYLTKAIEMYSRHTIENKSC